MYTFTMGLFRLVPIFLLGCVFLSHCEYEPNWKSLDSRPLPSWYDEAKFSIFLYWGVYSVPAYGGEWLWRNWKLGHKTQVDFMNKFYAPNFDYADFARDFKAEFFDPNEWADLLKDSGANPVKDYVVTNDRWGALTFCRHGGFYTCHDRFMPSELQDHKWENAMTIDLGSWSYRREARLREYNIMSIEKIVATLAQTIRYTRKVFTYWYSRLRLCAEVAGFY